MTYYKNKQERTADANAHTLEMIINYSKEINECVQRSKIYDDKNIPFITDIPLNRHKDSTLHCVQTTSDAILNVVNELDGKICILNFASYKNPGGQFLNGSNAQEESLCHHSFLFNVLNQFDGTYYRANRANVNKSLYTNRAIYSPDVIFFNKYKADVLTCAAPNVGAAKQYQNVEDYECRNVMEDRIKFVLKIAATEEVDNLILGAFGCGVFRNNAIFVAETFKKQLNKTFLHAFKNIYFPIPDDENYYKFERVMFE